MIKTFLFSLISKISLLSAASLFLEFEGLYLERGGSRAKVLVNQGVVDPYISVINAKQLVNTLGYEPAARAGVGFLGKSQGLYLRALASRSWQGQKTALGDNLNFPFEDPAYAPGYTGAYEARIDYKTNLRMCEAYYINEMSPRWKDSFALRFLAGLQYLNIPETVNANFYTDSKGGPQINTYYASTKNQLGIAGLGFMLQLRPEKYFAFEILALGGAGANYIQSKTTLGISDNTDVLRASREKVTTGAYSFLSTIRAVLRPFPWFEMGLGYEVIYAGGLALAYRQMSYQTQSTSDNQIRRKSNVWYQGGSVRLSIRI